MYSSQRSTYQAPREGCNERYGNRGLALDRVLLRLVVAGEQNELGFSLAMPGGVFASSGNASLQYRGCAGCLGDEALLEIVQAREVCGGVTCLT